MSSPIMIEILGENHVEPEQLELGPGDQIEWLNKTEQPCTLQFEEPSPFEDGPTKYEIPAGGNVQSAPVKQRPGPFSYKVRVGNTRARGAAFKSFGGETEDTTRSMKFDPVIIVRGPH